ncbi:uncharacterized protein LOC144486570 [Mustelus asterias]
MSGQRSEDSQVDEVASELINLSLTKQDEQPSSEDGAVAEKQKVPDSLDSPHTISSSSQGIHIYLIHEANTTYYKVGHSKNPMRRCRELQTGNPRQLTREHEVWVRDKEAEGRIFEALQEYKADLGGGTKWFRLDTEARVNEAKAAMNNEKWPDLLH